MTLAACGTAPDAPAQSVSTYRAPSVSAARRGDGPSFVGAGRLAPCDVVRHPLEQMGLVLRMGGGTATCLFTEKRRTPQGLSVTVTATAGDHPTIANSLVAPTKVGGASIEGAAKLDHHWMAETVCANLDLVMTSVGTTNYAHQAVVPVEAFLDCPPMA